MPLEPSSLLADLTACLRFYTRLPLPAPSIEMASAAPDFARLSRAVPVAGAVIGAIAALVLVLATHLGLPAALAAALAVTASIVVTGALHEDGLADCADGFGGGRDPATKLAIMKDSRLGTYGALALVLSLYVRIASLTLIALHSLALAASVLVAAAALSRVAGLLPLALLPPARSDGLGYAAAKPTRESFLVAALIAALILGTPFAAGAGFWRLFAATAFSIAAAYGVTRLARRQIHGQTGDVAGAAQQAAEILFLLILAGAAA